MSARIEDVLAEHAALGDIDGGMSIECDNLHCGVYRDGQEFAKHQAEMLRPVIAEVLRTGFNDGYASARRFYERAEDSPAPVTCQECGETVRHSACSHEKDICPGCVGKCFHCVAEMESA